MIPNAAPSSPPGPGLIENALFHLEFIDDQVSAYRTVLDAHGPVVRLWIGPLDIFLVTEPALIEEILVEQPRAFRKDVVTREVSLFLGQGLLVSDGDVWRRHRELVAPAFQPRQISSYADIMVEETEAMIDDWSDGEQLDFHRDISAMTLRIVVRALFGLEMQQEFDAIGDAIDDIMAYIDELRHSPWRYVPDPIPSPNQPGFERGKKRIDELIYQLIDERRRAEQGDDLLYQLLDATGDDGHQLSDEQLRDEVITLFMAGHETTALAITYAWFFVAQDAEVARRMREEVDEVVGDETPGVEHVDDLTYIEAVFRESMRRFPPAWAVGREAKRDVSVGDYTVPEGSQVIMPQCIVHNDPRWYDEPDAFRPSRWLDDDGELLDTDEDRPRMAYFPFGGGPRICVGNHFARMEALLVMATIASRCEFDHIGPDEMETYTSITQRPTDTVELRVRLR